jgi:hypothetical protein
LKNLNSKRKSQHQRRGGRHIQIVNKSSREEENNDVLAMNNRLWRVLATIQFLTCSKTSPFPGLRRSSVRRKRNRRRTSWHPKVRLAYGRTSSNMFALLDFKLL